MKKLFIIALMLTIACYFGTAQTKQSFGGKTETKTEQKPSGDKKTFEEPKEEKKVEPKKTDAPKSTKNAAKVYKGSIASLAGVAQGNYTITKDEAQKLTAKGGVLVFVEGNSGKKAKLYFLIDQDGSFIGDKLASYAANKFIGVKGWKKTVNGTNFIIVDFIESMD
jgi:hypothetical protein